LREENAKLQEQIGGSVSSVPFTGEETPLTAVEAYPEQYIGETFIVIGGIRVSDYYFCNYREARRTHVSLDFDELGPDKSSTGKSMYLYVRKEISEDLVKEITKTIYRGYQSKLIRAKVSILQNPYDPDCGIQAELINWQFLSSDKKSWQDVGTNDNLKGEIIYRGKKRNKQWFNYMYKEFQNKIVFVGGKYIYITGSTAYEPLTREQFADAINSGFILTKQSKVGDKTVEQSIP
jgi:hypothetical protein